MNRWTCSFAPRFAAVAALALSLALGTLAAQDSPLSISDYGLGTDVVDRELKGKSDRFEEGTKVAFLTRVVGGSDGDRIRHVWFHEKKEIVSIGLTIGGSHWRTYSRKTLPPGMTGAWAVEARDSEDRVLARAEFTCVPAGSGESSATPTP
jgi:hypothetical protein